MEQIEFRVVLKILTKQGEVRKPRQEPFVGDLCSDKTMVYKWHNLLKLLRALLGRPEVIISDIIDQI